MGSRLKRFYREWLKTWEVRICATLAATSLITLVIACPFLLDPAFYTLVPVYVKTQCLTTSGKYIEGASNCKWTSCRKGCTREYFVCWHVFVNYTVINQTTNETEYKEAVLQPNPSGCGYLPDVNCEEFFEVYGTEGANFTCYIGEFNSSLAITDLDYDKAYDYVSYMFIIFGIFILVMAHLFMRRGLCNCEAINPEKIRLKKEEALRQLRKRQKLISRLKRLQEREEEEYGSAQATFRMPKRAKRSKGSNSKSSSDRMSPESWSRTMDNTPGSIRRTSPLLRTPGVATGSLMYTPTKEEIGRHEISLIAPSHLVFTNETNGYGGSNHTSRFIKQQRIGMNLPGAITDDDSDSMKSPRHHALRT